jgi:F0F1-type ATP synthase membrane subunit a
MVTFTIILAVITWLHNLSYSFKIRKFPYSSSRGFEHVLKTKPWFIVTSLILNIATFICILITIPLL